MPHNFEAITSFAVRTHPTDSSSVNDLNFLNVLNAFNTLTQSATLSAAYTHPAPESPLIAARCRRAGGRCRRAFFRARFGELCTCPCDRSLPKHRTRRDEAYPRTTTRWSQTDPTSAA